MGLGGDRPREVFDRGLQQERTALAWDRTGVSMMVVGALYVRAGEAPYGALRHLPGFVAIAAGAWLILHGYRTYTRRHRLLRGARPLAEPGLVLLLTAATIAVSVASLALIVTTF